MLWNHLAFMNICAWLQQRLLQFELHCNMPPELELHCNS